MGPGQAGMGNERVFAVRYERRRMGQNTIPSLAFCHNDAMKRKKIKPNGHAVNADDLPPAEVSRLAQISPQRVAQKLRQGKSVNQILKEAENRRMKEMLRRFPLVPVPLDGADGVTSAASFALWQAKKEKALSELRELEVLEKTGELIPLAQVQLFTSNFLIEAKQLLERAPEMQDELAATSNPAECGAIVGRWAERVLGRIYAMDSLWNPPRDKSGGCAPISPQS
jgi:hypothetical protein